MNLFQIESDEADLAVFGFTCTYPRTLIALCLPGITYRHHYWWTRYRVRRIKFWYKSQLYCEAQGKGRAKG